MKFFILFEIYKNLLIIVFGIDRKNCFFCFYNIILLLNKFLVWMVMDVVLNDILNIMSRVDISVVVEKCGFLEELY